MFEIQLHCQTVKKASLKKKSKGLTEVVLASMRIVWFATFVVGFVCLVIIRRHSYNNEVELGGSGGETWTGQRGVWVRLRSFLTRRERTREDGRDERVESIRVNTDCE